MPLNSKVSAADLAHPHFVEWGAMPEGEPKDFAEKSFSDRSEAISFADDKSKRHQAVWLGEIGDYETDQGNIIRDWIYYWWNEKSLWPLSERGRCGGYPYHAHSKAVTYTPYDHSI